MSSKDSNIDWGLMGKYMSNEVNHFEKKKFEELTQNDQECQKAYNEAKVVCDEASYAIQYQQIDGDKAFANVISAINAPLKRRYFRLSNKVLAIAATAIVLIAISTFLLFLIPPAHDNKMVSLYSENGQRSLVLSDGSEVNINKMSTISYPSIFTADTRLINFEGEGFFSIKPDSTKPFIVLVGDLQVKVLGTAFNIKAYPNDSSMEVVVEHGKVEVSFGNQVVTLVKGDRAVVNKQSGALKKTENANVNFNAWTTKKMVFVETPLNEVACTIQSVYGVVVDIQDQSLLSNRLTANFYQSDVESIVKVICRTFNCDYQIEGGRYFIFQRPSN